MKNNLEKQKERLEAKLEELELKIQQEKQQVHYPKFEKLKNTYWKTERFENTSPYNSVTQYTKITDIKPINVINELQCFYSGWCFEIQNDILVSIIMECKSYVHKLGEQITKEEFTEAFNNATNEIKKII